MAAAVSMALLLDPGLDKVRKHLLNVAYGIYGDTSRTDNDYRVLLQYDPDSLKQYEQPLSQSRFNVTAGQTSEQVFLYTGTPT